MLFHRIIFVLIVWPFVSACNDSPNPDFPKATLESPNLIFVFTDQHAAKAWSRGGIAELETPNLERLADAGMTFTNCISNNPICTPYRASMLTGLHGHQNGFLNNHDDFPLDKNLPSWSKILKAGGYTMGYIGKWHLYPACEVPKFKEGKVDKPAALTPPKYRHGFDDLWIQTSNHNKPRSTYYWDTDVKYKQYEGYAPTGEMNQLLGFVSAHQHDSMPFCAVLSLLPPHNTYAGAPAHWVAHYDSIDTPFWENVPDRYRTARNMRNLKDYYAQVSAIDEEMGRLLNFLEDQKMVDNTIVIFTADHGDLHYAHGNFWKRYPWEESVNVPFIVRFPRKIQAGTVSKTLLGAIDLAPTILGLTGFGEAIPETMQGMDLSHVFFGTKGPTPTSQLIMYNLPSPDHYIHRNQPNLPDYRGVRTAEWTYAVRKLPRTGEVVNYLMHNNLTDPFQLNNLINNPKFEAQRQKLHEELIRKLMEVGEEKWLENVPKRFR